MPSQKDSSRKGGARSTSAPSGARQTSGIQENRAVGGSSPDAGLLAGGLHKKVQRGAQVLVVDDEVVVRRVVTDYLEGKGYNVVTVDSGQAALDWLRQNSPGIILLDIFMPGVNGLEVLREVKRTQPQVDVLVISGFADAELERKVKALGAIDCLRKPFDFNTLQTIVASRVGPETR